MTPRYDKLFFDTRRLVIAGEARSAHHLFEHATITVLPLTFDFVCFGAVALVVSAATAYGRGGVPGPPTLITWPS